jgi:hypothetical protein
VRSGRLNALDELVTVAVEQSAEHNCTRCRQSAAPGVSSAPYCLSDSSTVVRLGYAAAKHGSIFSLVFGVGQVGRDHLSEVGLRPRGGGGSELPMTTAMPRKGRARWAHTFNAVRIGWQARHKGEPQQRIRCVMLRCTREGDGVRGRPNRGRDTANVLLSCCRRTVN